jgi:hypothetical protein
VHQKTYLILETPTFHLVVDLLGVVARVIIQVVAPDSRLGLRVRVQGVGFRV